MSTSKILHRATFAFRAVPVDSLVQKFLNHDYWPKTKGLQHGKPRKTWATTHSSLGMVREHENKNKNKNKAESTNQSTFTVTRPTGQNYPGHLDLYKYTRGHGVKGSVHVAVSDVYTYREKKNRTPGPALTDTQFIVSQDPGT